MRTIFVVATLAGLALACGSESSNHGNGGNDGGGGGDGSSGDSGQDANPNPCAGLGCASMPGPLDVHVVDGSNALVAQPTFTEAGHALSASCVTDAGFEILDAGARCDTWRLANLGMGAHTITVSAPGYAAQSINVKIEGPIGCCGIGPTVDETVTLARGGNEGGVGDASDGG